MKLLTLTVQQLLLIALSGVACSTPQAALAQSDTTTDTGVTASASVADRYQSAIDKLLREITAAKAHRTALVSRMGDVNGELGKLESEKEALLNKTSRTFINGIAAIDQDIADIHLQLKEKNTLYQQQKKKVEEQALPSLLADALGSAHALQQHRKIATQKYLLYRVQMAIERSQEQQQLLQARKVALTQNNNKLQNNLGSFQQSVVERKQIRLALETQFTELSSTIVQKQDRLEQLRIRSAMLKKHPEQALFSRHRGQLPDPTAGKLQHRFSEPKAHGLLTWEGIMIATPMGQAIQAVFDGTVVFADHMQGLGDVAIIDHGEDYMSLYGMADFLIVEPGQHVFGGDEIGVVGDSTSGDSGLYFEIRHNASTLNPQDWLAFRQISQDNEP